jgi:hypothetical protein
VPMGGGMKDRPKKKRCFVIGPIGSDDSDVGIHADWLLASLSHPRGPTLHACGGHSVSRSPIQTYPLAKLRGCERCRFLPHDRQIY